MLVSLRLAFVFPFAFLCPPELPPRRFLVRPVRILENSLGTTRMPAAPLQVVLPWIDRPVSPQVVAGGAALVVVRHASTPAGGVPGPDPAAESGPHRTEDRTMLETDLRRSLEDARVIVAYTDDADSAPAARQAAFDAAERTGARVVLYALGDASPLESPTPTAWSGSRSGDQEFSDPLTEDDVEMLGRAGLAGQLRSGAERGIEAHAWVPDEGGVDAMIDYARRHGADVVLLPEEHEEPGLLERLTGAEPTDEAAQQAPIPVVLVASDGSLRDARS